MRKNLSQNLKPPCEWENLKTAHKECFNLLIDLTSEVYAGKDSLGRVPDTVEQAAIQPALDSNIIKLKEGQICFAAPQYRFEALSCFVAQMKLLPAWDDRESFLSTVRDSFLKSQEYIGGEFHRRSLVILHNDLGRDLVSFMEALSSTEHQFWDFYSHFTEVLPHIRTNPQPLLQTLAKVIASSVGDLTSGQVFKSVRDLAQQQPDLGVSLLEEILQEPEEPLTDLIPVLLGGLSTGDLNWAHQESIRLAASATPLLRPAGTKALGILDYTSHGAAAFLTKTREVLEKMRVSEDAEILPAVAYSFGCLFEVDPPTVEALCKLSELPDANVQMQISLFLFRQASQHSEKPWLRHILFNLATVDAECNSIIHKLDHVLGEVAKTNPPLIVRFLEEWIDNHASEEHTTNANIVESFSFTVSRILEHGSPCLEEIITQWFSTENQRLNHAASSLITSVLHRTHSTHPMTLSLHKDTLDNLNDTEIVHILHMILGYVNDPHCLCSLCFSILRKSRVSRAMKDRLVAAFADFILYNYPETGFEYLEKRRGSSVQKERDLARRSIERANEYFEPLKRIERLREFHPPTKRVHEFGKAESKVFQQVAKEEEDKSILRKLCTTITVLGGRRCFSDQSGGFSSRSGFHEFRMSIEAPRGERIDPIGQRVARFRWRNSKKDAQS